MELVSSCTNLKFETHARLLPEYTTHVNDGKYEWNEWGHQGKRIYAVGVGDTILLRDADVPVFGGAKRQFVVRVVEIIGVNNDWPRCIDARLRLVGEYNHVPFYTESTLKDRPDWRPKKKVVHSEKKPKEKPEPLPPADPRAVAAEAYWAELEGKAHRTTPERDTSGLDYETWSHVRWPHVWGACALLYREIRSGKPRKRECTADCVDCYIEERRDWYRDQEKWYRGMIDMGLTNWPSDCEKQAEQYKLLAEKVTCYVHGARNK